MAGYGLGGASLAGFGTGQRDDAMAALGQVAQTEQRREQGNEIAEMQRKAGNQQLGGALGGLGGAALGAQFGSVGGPLGMAIGSVVGTIASSLF